MAKLPDLDITDEARSILSAPSVIEQLNRDAMFFEVGIVWTAIRKRGKRIEGTTANGRLVIWDTAGDVLRFSKSEAVVADALGIVLPQPRPGKPTENALSWRRIAALILQLAERDRAELGDAKRLDLEEAIQTVHCAAGYPCPDTEDKIYELILDLQQYRRDPHATTVPPCVFTVGRDVYVHRPTLRMWLSTPAGHNRLYPVSELHAGLLAAEFAYVRDFRIQRDGKRLRIDLWKGPMNALGGDEAEIVEEGPN